MELHQGNMFPFKSRFKSTCGVCSLTRSELSETPGRRVLVCLSNQNPRLKCPVLELFDSPLCVCSGQKHVLKKLAHFLKRQGKVKGQSEETEFTEYYWWRWRFVFAFGGGGGSSLTSRSPKNIPELVKGWLSITYRCACEWFISIWWTTTSVYRPLLLTDGIVSRVLLWAQGLLWWASGLEDIGLSLSVKEKTTVY